MNSMNMLPFYIFCSFFTLISMQTLTIMMIINTILFFIFFLKISLNSWMGFWFLISYNSGIMVMLLYLTSMSKFMKSFWIFFAINLTFLYNINFLFEEKYFLMINNSEESHFLVFEDKNWWICLLCFSLILTLLMSISKTLNKSKMSSRIILLYSL